MRASSRGIGPRRRHSAGDRVACRRAYTLEPRCHTRQTRCTPYARRVEIDWTHRVDLRKGRRPPWSTFAYRSVSISSSLVQPTMFRPEHPVRGSLGPPAPQPETEPASAMIPTARDTLEVLPACLRPAEPTPTAAPGGHADSSTSRHSSCENSLAQVSKKTRGLWPPRATTRSRSPTPLKGR